MRCFYLVVDVPVLQFSSNRLARGMNKPTSSGMMRLKRVGRYFHAHPRWVQRFPLQEYVEHVDVFGDSDWAGDPVDRKSISCTVTMHGKHCVRSHVATRTAPALSSGEAEYVSSVKAGSTGLGMQSMAKDYG
eukprot:4316071-Karenia_brevis.AAC.1